MIESAITDALAMMSNKPQALGSRFKLRGRSAVIFFLTGMIFFGCRGLGLIKGTAHDLTDRYRLELNHWTRQTEIYYNLEFVLSLAATYQSGPFRTAHVEEYARIYELKEVDKKKRLSDQLEAADLAYEFLFAVHVPKRKWDDFQTKGSMWKIFLKLNDKERLDPEEIVKLKGNDAVIRYFYPYISPWKSIYRIRFSKTPMKEQVKNVNKMSDRLTLVITGAPGRAELNWTFTASEAR